MDQEQKSIENWRDEVSTEAKEILKIADGEKVQFVFLDEGFKGSHPDYGSYVAFNVSNEKGSMLWYVNANNYDLLGQIKELKTLTGMKVEVERTGAKKSDTRYSIKKIE